MKVLIDKEVVAKIDDFYTAAMSNHISLSEETVSAKKQRLIAALRSLVDYHFVYPKARLKKEWINAGWQECICEDFHFAYEVCLNETGETIIWIRDAVHSLMYH